MVDVRGHREEDRDNLSARLASSLGRTAPKSPSEAIRPEPVPPPPPRSQTVRHPLVVLLNFAVTVVLAVMLLGGGAIFVARFQFQQPGSFDDERVVAVKAGASADEVADLVQRDGLGNRWIFLAGIRLEGQGANLKAGEYRVPAHASLQDIMQEMINGRVVAHRVTIPEGLTTRQVVDCLMADTALVNGYTSGLTSEQVDNCRRNTEGLTGTIASLPAEGSLLPDTYAFSRGDTRQSVIDRMASDQARMVSDIWSRRAADVPLKSPAELVTLASIIEKETSRADERSRVAAVYVNRLRIKMKLDADPTLVYAVFNGSAPPAGYRLTNTDKQVISPYNTYTNAGLPPGPIANPGRASLEAAANPSRTKDLYFVADGSGGHVFAETFEDHQRNVSRYRVSTDPVPAAVTPATAFAPVSPPATATPAAAAAAAAAAGGSPSTSKPGSPASAPQPQPRPATRP